jgi:hypothetical protein
MAGRAGNDDFEGAVPPTEDSVSAEHRLVPILMEDEPKLTDIPLQDSRPQPLAIHDIRELLHITGMVLAVAQTRTSNDFELLHFLRLGERAIADVATLLAVHFPKGL